jgi:hypothetical protein
MSEVHTAKPTVYDGTLYRSRLEAGFAEWLTSNGATFEYEFEPIGSESYLPDFTLFYGSDDDLCKLFIEIKPIRFCSESWVAIRAAQECGECLMVIDSPERGQYGCYASVYIGTLTFYTSRRRMMPEVGFDNDRKRPVFYFCGPFSSTE